MEGLVLMAPRVAMDAAMVEAAVALRCREQAVKAAKEAVQAEAAAGEAVASPKLVLGIRVPMEPSESLVGR